MSLALAFLTGLLATLTAGAVARLVATLFTSHSSARIAGFCVALGFALGEFSHSGPTSREAALAVLTALGSLVALPLLWVWLLKKPQSSPIE